MNIFSLSKREREVLAAAQLRADASIPELAKLTEFRAHTVRHCLQRLLDGQIISMYPFVNIYPLGYEEYGVFFSMPAAKSVRRSMLEALKSSERVTWVLQVGGDFQYGAAICAKSATEVSAFFDHLCTKFGDVFYEKSIAVRISWTLFPRKYLSQKFDKQKPLYAGDIGKSVSIDEIDHRLLSGLSSLDYKSIRDLSQQLEMSHSTVHYRLKRLRDEGVLSGFAYGVDATKFGMQPYRLLVSMRRISLSSKEKMYQFCHRHRNVVALIQCIGSWDYEIKVEIASPAELTTLIDDLHDQFGTAIHAIKVLSVLETIKLEFYSLKTLSPSPGGKVKRAAAFVTNTVRHFD